jgi:hypothetical protein
VLKQIEPFDFFILLCAFFYGNLFALQFSTINWGFLLIFIIVFFLEAINKFLYLLLSSSKNTFLEDNALSKKRVSFLEREENAKDFSIKERPVLVPKLINFEKKMHVGLGISYFLTAKKRKKFFKYSFLFTNLVKRGFLLGFFVEAFKVGS